MKSTFLDVYYGVDEYGVHWKEVSPEAKVDIDVFHVIGRAAIGTFEKALPTTLPPGYVTRRCKIPFKKELDLIQLRHTIIVFGYVIDILSEEEVIHNDDTGCELSFMAPRGRTERFGPIILLGANGKKFKLPYMIAGYGHNKEEVRDMKDRITKIRPSSEVAANKRPRNNKGHN